EGPVELGGAGSGAAPASDGCGDDGPAGLVDRDYGSAEGAGGVGTREGKRGRIGGDDATGDHADFYGVGGIGIENAKTGAIVVGQRRVGLLRSGTDTVESTGGEGIGIHHGAPDSGVAEAEKMSELVSED